MLSLFLGTPKKPWLNRDKIKNFELYHAIILISIFLFVNALVLITFRPILMVFRGFEKRVKSKMATILEILT